MINDSLPLQQKDRERYKNKMLHFKQKIRKILYIENCFTTNLRLENDNIIKCFTTNVYKEKVIIIKYFTSNIGIEKDIIIKCFTLNKRTDKSKAI